MNEKKILLFGATGFLGQRILSKNKQILAPKHSSLDLLDLGKVFKYIEQKKPNQIIYAAGITKIDFAQKNKKITHDLNYRIPKQISKFVSKAKVNFTYVSTDAVFDGYKNKFEFSENDKTLAKSVYGISKLRGEEAILANDNNTVVRLITLFGIGNKNNFLQKMIDSLKSGKEFFGINDQIQNPLNVDIAAEAILYLVENDYEGIYNLGALSSDSNYNFLVKTARKQGLNYKLIREITFDKFMENKIAHRKRKSVLRTDKFSKLSKNKILKTLDDSIAYLNLK
jgi:dTDP-4-dehydrorhamnose reductase